MSRSSRRRTSPATSSPSTTGLMGFVFYFLIMMITSIGLLAKSKFSVQTYFDSWSRILIEGVFGGLMSFVLFWSNRVRRCRAYYGFRGQCEFDIFLGGGIVIKLSKLHPAYNNLADLLMDIEKVFSKE